MGKKKNRQKREEVSDADLQGMIDDGLIVGSEETDFSTNYEAYEMARGLAGKMCECGRTDPHVHIMMERPKDSNLSDEELQAMAQRHFDEAIKKKIREKEQAEKRRKLGLGD